VPIVRGVDWARQELSASELAEISETASRLGVSGTEIIHRRSLGLADDGSPLSAAEAALREGEAAARRLVTPQPDVTEGAGGALDAAEEGDAPTIDPNDEGPRGRIKKPKR